MFISFQKFRTQPPLLYPLPVHLSLSLSLSLFPFSLSGSLSLPVFSLSPPCPLLLLPPQIRRHWPRAPRPTPASDDLVRSPPTTSPPFVFPPPPLARPHLSASTPAPRDPAPPPSRRPSSQIRALTSVDPRLATTQTRSVSARSQPTSRRRTSLRHLAVEHRAAPPPPAPHSLPATVDFLLPPAASPLPISSSIRPPSPPRLLQPPSTPPPSCPTAPRSQCLLHQRLTAARLNPEPSCPLLHLRPVASTSSRCSAFRQCPARRRRTPCDRWPRPRPPPPPAPLPASPLRSRSPHFATTRSATPPPSTSHLNSTKQPRPLSPRRRQPRLAVVVVVDAARVIVQPPRVSCSSVHVSSVIVRVVVQFRQPSRSRFRP